MDSMDCELTAPVLVTFPPSRIPPPSPTLLNTPSHLAPLARRRSTTFPLPISATILLFIAHPAHHARFQADLAGFDPIPASQPLPSPTSTPLDALSPTPEESLVHLQSELDYEILEIRRVLRVGGHAVWRSAAKRPWYIQRYQLAGFKVEPIDIRENGAGICKVNMYASCEYTSWALYASKS